MFKYLSDSFYKFTIMPRESHKALVLKLLPIYNIMIILAVIIASGCLMPNYVVLEVILFIVCLSLGVYVFAYTFRFVNKVVK